jgi:acyl-ACP thioesterase
LARLVQDAGNDDLEDAGLDANSPWVTRRTSVWAPDEWPRLGDALTLTTFCSGLGGRWGERRTSVRSSGGVVELAAVWIHLDRQGRPARLPDTFLAVYGESAAGRRTTTRLHHPPPPAAATWRPWPLRATDLDVFGHVNNTAVWMPIEDEMARHRFVPRFAEIEYRVPLAAGDQVVLKSHHGDDGLRLWLTTAAGVRASALIVAAS